MNLSLEIVNARLTKIEEFLQLMYTAGLNVGDGWGVFNRKEDLSKILGDVASLRLEVFPLKSQATVDSLINAAIADTGLPLKCFAGNNAEVYVHVGYHDRDVDERDPHMKIEYKNLTQSYMIFNPMLANATGAEKFPDGYYQQEGINAVLEFIKERAEGYEFYFNPKFIKTKEEISLYDLVDDSTIVMPLNNSWSKPGKLTECNSIYILNKPFRKTNVDSSVMAINFPAIVEHGLILVKNEEGEHGYCRLSDFAAVYSSNTVYNLIKTHEVAFNIRAK